jgi:hypothetical protein
MAERERYADEEAEDDCCGGWNTFDLGPAWTVRPKAPGITYGGDAAVMLIAILSKTIWCRCCRPLVVKIVVRVCREHHLAMQLTIT